MRYEEKAGSGDVTHEKYLQGIRPKERDHGDGIYLPRFDHHISDRMPLSEQFSS